MLEGGCDPAWGSGAAPDSASLLPRAQVGDRDSQRGAAAHSGLQWEETGDCAEPLEQGRGPAGVGAGGSQLWPVAKPAAAPGD